MFRRLASLAAGITALTLAVSMPASAHIDPDPKQAQAGSTLSIGFTVEHGCDGSPTVQLDMRLPEGVTGAMPDPAEGWAESIEGDVVTFVGGPLADDVEATFSVTMTLPPTPDTTIYFPFVQRCDVGEIRWIGIPAEPGDELDEPAPALLLTGPVASTTVPPTTTAPVSATTEVPVTVPSDDPADTTPVTDTTPTTDPTGTTEPVVTGIDADADPNTGTWFFIATVATVLGLGAFVAFRARSARQAREIA
ncbi:MAG TPA: YcnI family protein [Ilumatobacteraceae bacterium]|nr:YcnI family protein [Ilumatobacteraceae bacterium]